MPEKKAQRGRLGDLGARLATSAVVIPVLLWLLFWAPRIGFLLLVIAATAIGASELFGMTLPKRRVLQGLGVSSSVGVCAVFIFQPSELAIVTVLLGVLVVGLLGGLFAPAPIETAAARTGWLVAGPLYIGGLLATLVLLHQRQHGGAWVVLAMMLAWFGDTFAYFAGRAFGKHKLYERVSPKKTIEGAAGGLAGSAAGALLAHFWYLPDLPLVGGIALAVVAGALGQAGDLVESLIKRSCGVKDSGFIVPGHGGLLDRIDALMLTAAATWVFAAWFVDGHGG